MYHHSQSHLLYRLVHYYRCLSSSSTSSITYNINAFLLMIFLYDLLETCSYCKDCLYRLCELSLMLSALYHHLKLKLWKFSRVSHRFWTGMDNQRDFLTSKISSWDLMIGLIGTRFEHLIYRVMEEVDF